MPFNTFPKAWMQNVLQPLAYIKKTRLHGGQRWEQLHLNTLWMELGNPFVGRVRKCCISRFLEPFTSCWSSYQFTYFLLLTLNSFKRALSNLISIQGPLKYLWNFERKRKWWLCHFFFLTSSLSSSSLMASGRVVSESSGQVAPFTSSKLLPSSERTYISSPLQMNQVESMRGAQAFKGRNPSRETVSRAGRFFNWLWSREFIKLWEGGGVGDYFPFSYRILMLLHFDVEEQH